MEKYIREELLVCTHSLHEGRAGEACLGELSGDRENGVKITLCYPVSG